MSLRDKALRYVDLQSRLRNLEVTRERIRAFMEQAQNVEEALMVNAELKAIEAEIEAVQGRVNYLFDRASYSTINVQFSPALLDLTPTPTPTPEPWSAGRVAANAGNTFTAILRVLAELVIWLSIVVLPFVLPPVVLVVGIRYLFRRKRA